MKPTEVPEAAARQMTCPTCGALRDYPCLSNRLRGGHNRAQKRTHASRRKAWLERNDQPDKGTYIQ